MRVFLIKAGYDGENMAMSRLSDRLHKARQRQIIGRTHERELFRATLDASELPFSVLYVFGPGGIGKTTLLGEFAALCEERHTPYTLLDARSIEPHPEVLLAALPPSLTAAPNQEAPPREQDDTSTATRYVLLIDTYEELLPLDHWLRETLLPELPEETLIVLASNNPPAPEWRADPGWRELVRLLPLRNLDPQESRTYLERSGVPAKQFAQVLAFTHGHPLALSLVADLFAQRRDFEFQPEAEPDIIRALLERLVQKVPGPAHRAALEVCALVRQTTEAQLREMLGMADVHELFDWLRGLSFIESERRGLVPHSLAREALTTDLRWRNPDWNAELHRRARAYYAKQLQQTHDQEQQQSILLDYIYLHRNSPILRLYLSSAEWGGSGPLLADTLRAADVPLLLEMVRRHEGEASALLAERWLALQQRGVTVLRDPQGMPAGFLAVVALHEASAEEITADPAAQRVWSYLQARAPLRSGEKAAFIRFWMARDTYQAFSNVQAQLGVHIIRYYLTTPGLAYSFFPCAEPDFWTMILTYADLHRIPEAEYDIEGRHYGIFGHDWRAVPPVAWLNLLAERETALAPQRIEPPATVEQVVALSELEFAQAVRQALQGYARADKLRGNVLVRSRLVTERAGAEAGSAERGTALRTILDEAAELLKASPREVKLYRVLYHTYLHPASTQERAAELLDLPFSTYRRHLKAAVARLAEVLWQWELPGA
jgi:hypothetical protein